MSYKIWLLLILITVQIALGISPSADRTTWFLENLPTFIILPFLFKVRFTNFTLTLMLIHALILALGGHYTYAKVPLGFWMQEAFHFSRNHYDRIGHFAQGFVPFFIYRELLLRHHSVARGKLLTVICLSFCLSFSALYELFEWATALSLGQGADDFLGTQGDIWDTQTDMFMCLVGGIVATFFVKLHDRALQIR